jgi:ankyrin repeat protein
MTSLLLPLKAAIQNKLRGLLKAHRLIFEQRSTHASARRLPTVLAVARGRREILELLLNAGANVNDCDRLGKTPCYAAVQWARTELVALLIARGAALHNTHHSLLSMSSSLSTDDISLLLIESGAPLDDVRRRLSRRRPQCCGGPAVACSQCQFA